MPKSKKPRGTAHTPSPGAQQRDALSYRFYVRITEAERAAIEGRAVEAGSCSSTVAREMIRIGLRSRGLIAG